MFRDDATLAKIFNNSRDMSFDALTNHLKKREENAFITGYRLAVKDMQKLVEFIKVEELAEKKIKRN